MYLRFTQVIFPLLINISISIPIQNMHVEGQHYLSNYGVMVVGYPLKNEHSHERTLAVY